MANFLSQFCQWYMTNKAQQEFFEFQDKKRHDLQNKLKNIIIFISSHKSIKYSRFPNISQHRLIIKSHIQPTYCIIQVRIIIYVIILIIYQIIGMEMRDDFVSRTIKTQKVFGFNPGNCYYVNIEVTKKNQKSGQDSKIKISNNVCKENDSSLIKVTQVRFGNRVIYIEDTYFFKPVNGPDNQMHGKNQTAQINSSDGSTNNNSIDSKTSSKNSHNNKKKKLIFKKKFAQDNSNHKLQKRNTKNIAKNFCKAFMGFVEELHDKQIFIKVKELVCQNKYNNKVIEKMANDSSIAGLFKNFLQNKAEQWINSSKIHDKQIHFQAIKLYLQLIQNGDNEVQQQDSSQMREQKSIFHSDSQYEGSNEDNGRQSAQK